MNIPPKSWHLLYQNAYRIFYCEMDISWRKTPPPPPSSKIISPAVFFFFFGGGGVEIFSLSAVGFLKVIYCLFFMYEADLIQRRKLISPPPPPKKKKKKKKIMIRLQQRIFISYLFQFYLWHYYIWHFYTQCWPPFKSVCVGGGVDFVPLC